LLLTAIVFASLFRIPFAVSDQPSTQFLSDGDFDVNDHPVLIGLTVTGAFIALITIFLYKRRKVQLKLGYLIIVVAILLPVIAFLLFTRSSANAESYLGISDQLGLFIPLIAILFTVLANHFIKKDEKLVKSMDRLR
jgi:cell division protein FtsW (lipid II flippase)